MRADAMQAAGRAQEMRGTCERATEAAVERALDVARQQQSQCAADRAAEINAHTTTVVGIFPPSSEPQQPQLP
eukprot:COSAG01_NODE_861_length_13035_cov_6.890449_7_plen_73_part_00